MKLTHSKKVFNPELLGCVVKMTFKNNMGRVVNHTNKVSGVSESIIIVDNTAPREIESVREIEVLQFSDGTKNVTDPQRAELHSSYFGKSTHRTIKIHDDKNNQYSVGIMHDENVFSSKVKELWDVELTKVVGGFLSATKIDGLAHSLAYGDIEQQLNHLRRFDQRKNTHEKIEAFLYKQVFNSELRGSVISAENGTAYLVDEFSNDELITIDIFTAEERKFSIEQASTLTELTRLRGDYNWIVELEDRGL